MKQKISQIRAKNKGYLRKMRAQIFNLELNELLKDYDAIQTKLPDAVMTLKLIENRISKIRENLNKYNLENKGE